MSHADVQPDAVVRTALQMLPVPAHADDFWTRVDAGLDGASSRSRPLVAFVPPVAIADPVVTRVPPEAEPDPTRALVPRTLRRTSNLLLLGVAAVALVVVGLAGRTLLDARRDGASVAPEAPTTASAELDARLEEARLGSGAPAELSAEQAEAASAAVLSWVDSLRAGRAEAAWENMGAESHAHFGSLAAFEADMAEVAADHAGWEEDPDQVVVTPVSADDGVVVAVVTLVGTADGGTTATDAVPVRLVDGDALVEPYASAGALEAVVPEPSPLDGELATVGSGDELMVVVPDGAQPPVLRLDDGPTVVCGESADTELIALEELPGRRCAYLPSEEIEAGVHTLTVALAGSDGAAISAESLLFEVA